MFVCFFYSYEAVAKRSPGNGKLSQRSLNL